MKHAPKSPARPLVMPIAIPVMAMALTFLACDTIMESPMLSSIAKTAKKIEQKPIPTVKRGHLEGCPEVTVEEMFNASDSDTGIFRNEKPKWEHHVGENGIDYVNVSHYEMVDGKPARVAVRFWVKGGEFGIQAFKHGEDVVDASEQEIEAFVRAGCAAALANRASDSTTLARRAEDIVPQNAFKDPRNGKVYTMLFIGGHTWMAENLNFATANSKCYNDDNSYCTIYGRLYSFREATAACPDGWRLPSNGEWSDLVIAAGGRATAGRRLKSVEGWNNGGNGTDALGFSAMPGGTFGPGPSGGSAAFAAGGTSGRWWSATEHRDGSAFYMAMHNSESSVIVGNDSSYLFSVRCVMEEAIPQAEPQIAPQATPQPAKQQPVAAKAQAPVLPSAPKAPKTSPTPTQQAVRKVPTDPERWAQVGVFTDLRDNQAYKTVTVGWQTWMAKNLNYRSDKSVCYKKDNSYCDKYGRLYYWKDASGACPAGWRLPNNKDWETLVNAAGGRDIAGKALKSTGGWDKSGNGTDDFGFSALPGGNHLEYSGCCDDDDMGGSGFFNIGGVGIWWSATAGYVIKGHSYARNYWYMTSEGGKMSLGDEGCTECDSYELGMRSVRCIQN